MSSGMLFQVLVNLMFAAGFVAIWIRLNKPAKDDPRLSRGLQLLQSKIAILEDLSDQVERQVQQVAQLMEVKTRDLQRHIEKSDDQIRQIEAATSKSLEVARIFQDRIPHEEMMDRKSTLKYVKAARLSNKGMTIDEIAEQVDLSRGELEFVTKVNRENLQFSEADLPEWAKEIAGMTSGEFELEPESAPPVLENTMAEAQPLMRVSDRSVNSIEPLDQLGRKFREAMESGMLYEAETSGQIETSVSSTVVSKNSVPKTPVRPLDRNNGTAFPSRSLANATTTSADLHRAAQPTPVAFRPRLEEPAVPVAPVLGIPKEPMAFNRAAALASKNAGERLIQRVVFPNVNQ